MNRTLSIALALACAAAASARADDITVDPNPFVSTATRAQVVQDLHAFRQAGVIPWADDYNPLATFRGERTRAEVKADFLASRKEVAAYSAEDSGSSFIAGLKVRSARPARNELARAE